MSARSDRRAAGGRQLALGVRLRADCRLENYVATEGDTAVTALRGLLAGTAHGRIYLQGPAASGKSHLIEATCDAGAAAGLRVVYVPLAQRARWSPELLSGLSQLDLVCLDDLHALHPDPAWERAVFNLFNDVDARGSRLLIASRQAPGHHVLPDLVSRLEGMLRIRVEPPDDLRRARILKQRAAQLGFGLGDDAVHYLLAREARDLHSLMGLLEGVDRYALSAKRKVTRALIRDYLEAREAAAAGVESRHPG